MFNFEFKKYFFLGNSGVSALSILISLSYIREYNINQTLLCDEIFLIFLIPGIDMTRLVFSRIIFRKSISDADLNHLHHYFINLVDKKYVFIVYLIYINYSIFNIKIFDRLSFYNFN